MSKHVKHDLSSKISFPGFWISANVSLNPLRKILSEDTHGRVGTWVMPSETEET